MPWGVANSPGPAPGVQKFALSAKPVDSRVGVPVGHKDFPARSHCYVSGMVKGTMQGWHLPRAYPEKHLTFSAEFHHFMSVSVHQEDLVIGGYVDSVGIQELTITPGGEQAAISVKDQNRRVLTLVNVDPVVRIGGDVGGVSPGHALRKLPEGMDHLINVVTRSNYVSVHDAFTFDETAAPPSSSTEADSSLACFWL